LVGHDARGDILGPEDPPYNGLEVPVSSKLDSARAESVRVTISYVVQVMLDKFTDMGRPAREVPDEDGSVERGLANVPVSAQANELGEVLEGIVEGGEESPGNWQDAGRMLEAPDHRSETLQRHSAFPQYVTEVG
jgi:hypothetical protein